MEMIWVISIVPPSYEKKVKETLLHLGRLFAEDENAQVLIFTERQETAEDLLSKLYKSKYFSVNTIHGAKDQTDRNEAINDFKQGVLSILIATSVAARGLDVPGLAMVLNFDSPTHLEDYVHRCGRTGRAGNKGTAITLIENSTEGERHSLHIVKALKESGTAVPPELQQMANTFHEKAKAGTEKYYGGFGGKGLDKLDAARALDKKREKRQLKLEGVEDSDDEEEIAPIKKPEVAGPGVVPASDGAAAAADSDDQPEWMKLLNSKIVVSKTERPEAAAPGKPMSARDRAMAAANKVDTRLSKKGMIHAGQPIDNKGPDAGLYHSTLEINGFPQKARWAVTNRTNVAKVLEATVRHPSPSIKNSTNLRSRELRSPRRATSILPVRRLARANFPRCTSSSRATPRTRSRARWWS
jgi:ATP-dependent RNA helicase DDX46/PRP5